MYDISFEGIGVRNESGKFRARAGDYAAAVIEAIRFVKRICQTDDVVFSLRGQGGFDVYVDSIYCGVLWVTKV